MRAPMLPAQSNKSGHAIVALAGMVALGSAMTLAKAPTELMRCVIDEGAVMPCRYVDVVTGDGAHHMNFFIGRRHVAFVGRSQSGWWSGTLDGRQAMAFERNRGNMVASTIDLKHRFSWWYPANEHGTY